MNLTQSHLDTAVSRDIITPDQRKALRDLAAEAPSLAEQRSRREDEQFRFITGFNDIFLAIGVGLFIAAAVMTAQLFSFSLFGTTAAALAMWLVSEILAVRMRRAIPSMMAAVAFVAFAVAATIDLFPDPMRVGPALYAYLLAGSACVWTGLYFIRFRLPFSLFLVGGALVGLGFVIVVHAVIGGPENLEAFFSVEKLTATYALASGLVVFIVAMWFDRKDPDRTTLNTDYAFWLHLLGAPLIVHALMYLATGRELGTIVSLQSALWVVGIFVALSIVALVIDRRAILVAALAYLGGALWYLASRSQHAANNAELYSILLIAILVIGLGVGWHSIRRTLFRIPVLRSVEGTVLSKQA